MCLRDGTVLTIAKGIHKFTPIPHIIQRFKNIVAYIDLLGELTKRLIVDFVLPQSQIERRAEILDIAVPGHLPDIFCFSLQSRIGKNILEVSQRIYLIGFSADSFELLFNSKKTEHGLA